MFHKYNNKDDCINYISNYDNFDEEYQYKNLKILISKIKSLSKIMKSEFVYFVVIFVDDNGNKIIQKSHLLNELSGKLDVGNVNFIIEYLDYSTYEIRSRALFILIDFFSKKSIDKHTSNLIRKVLINIVKGIGKCKSDEEYLASILALDNDKDFHDYDLFKEIRKIKEDEIGYQQIEAIRENWRKADCSKS